MLRSGVESTRFPSAKRFRPRQLIARLKTRSQLPPVCHRTAGQANKSCWKTQKIASNRRWKRLEISRSAGGCRRSGSSFSTRGKRLRQFIGTGPPRKSERTLRNFAAICAISQRQIDKSGWNSLNSSVLLIHCKHVLSGDPSRGLRNRRVFSAE